MNADRPPRPHVSRLYRYPVKGLTPEELPEVTLRAGEAVPGDRMFALARPDTEFDEDNPRALPKTRFVMLQKDAVLARVRSSYDPSTGVLTFGPADGGPEQTRRADLATAAGRAELEKFVAELVGPELGGQPRLVEARGSHRFTDAGSAGAELMHAVSVVNLASVRDLADRIGVPVDPLRFRANIYLDGLAPWSELSWPGSEIGLGGVRVRALVAIPRCAATAVNPATGERDIRMLRELADHYGHTNCGVYVTVLTGGTLRPGDPIDPPAAAPDEHTRDGRRAREGREEREGDTR